MELADQLIGHVLDGRYRVEKKIGEGGMGVVLAARHVGLGQRVAIKLMQPDADPVWRRRFVREARAASRIESDHVATVFDVGLAENGAPYLTMEFLEGRDLAAVMADDGPLPVQDALTYCIHACRALEAAHALGIVHRDVKPANLFLTTRDDGTPCIKLLDFGISKQHAEVGTLTGTHAVLGSPQFMSPEQLSSCRDVDQRADIWSLGATLFELLTLEHVFAGGSLAELCTSIMRDAPRRLEAYRPDVPDALSAIVARCLDKDAGRRFQSAAELERHLSALRDLPLSMRPTLLAPPPVVPIPSQRPACDTLVMSHDELADEHTPLASVRPVVTTTRRPPRVVRRRSRLAVASFIGLMGFALALETPTPASDAASDAASEPTMTSAPVVTPKPSTPTHARSADVGEDPPRAPREVGSSRAPSVFSDSGRISQRNKDAIERGIDEARRALEAGHIKVARSRAITAMTRLRGVGIRPNEGVSSLGARLSLLRGDIEAAALDELLATPIQRAEVKKRLPLIEHQLMKAQLAYQQVRGWSVPSFYRCAVVETAELHLAIGQAFAAARPDAPSASDGAWLVKAAASWLRKAHKGFRVALRVPAETTLCSSDAKAGLRATDSVTRSLSR